MSNNSSKGAYKLASELQKRMKKVSRHDMSVNAEFGSIVNGKKLKVDSLPESVLDTDDYTVCSSAGTLSKGDRVLVIWTNDGEPVVIGKV